MFHQWSLIFGPVYRDSRRLCPSHNSGIGPYLTSEIASNPDTGYYKRRQPGGVLTEGEQQHRDVSKTLGLGGNGIL